MATLSRAVRLLPLVAALIGATTSAAAEAPDCTRPLTLALYERGLLYSSQTGTGIDRDIADELIRRSGCKISVAVMQRARIWQLIETGALDFSLSGVPTEARERFAAFATYFSNRHHLLVHRDTGVGRLDEFVARPPLLLGAIRSFRYGPAANRFIDRLADEGRVSYSTSLEPLYRLLIEQRIHGMIVEPFDYPALLDRQLQAQTTLLDFRDPPVPHGLVMSRRALAPPQQRAWRELLETMRADGTVQRIFEKHFRADLAREMTAR